jgi:hypothetical protein
VESGDRRLGRSESGLWKTGTSKAVVPTYVGRGPMGWTPRASIERTNCILVYGPSKPSSLTSTEGGFTPIASMIGLGEKLGTDPWIRQSSCCGFCREPFLLGVVALSIPVDDFTKGSYMQTT